MTTLAKPKSCSVANTPNATSQNDLVELLPSEVVFEWTAGKDMHSHIGIHNTSGQPVAFKLKTSSLDTYRVRPTTGVIDVDSTVYVKIVKRAEKMFKDASECARDRFMVQAVPVDWEGMQDGRRQGEDSFDERAAAMSFHRDRSAPTQLYVRVRVIKSKPSAWPTNADEFERLSSEVEIKLREAMMLEGPDRQAQILVQFGVLMLTKGQMSMQQFNVLKKTVSELADSRRLEEHYRNQRRGRSHSRGRSSSRSNSHSRTRTSRRSQGLQRSSSSGMVDIMYLDPAVLHLKAIQGSSVAKAEHKPTGRGAANSTSGSSEPSSAGRAESLVECQSVASSQGTQAGKIEMMARWLVHEPPAASTGPSSSSTASSAATPPSMPSSMRGSMHLLEGVKDDEAVPTAQSIAGAATGAEAPPPAAALTAAPAVPPLVLSRSTSSAAAEARRHRLPLPLPQQEAIPTTVAAAAGKAASTYPSNNGDGSRTMDDDLPPGAALIGEDYSELGSDGSSSCFSSARSAAAGPLTARVQGAPLFQQQQQQQGGQVQGDQEEQWQQHQEPRQEGEVDNAYDKPVSTYRSFWEDLAKQNVPPTKVFRRSWYHGYAEEEKGDACPLPVEQQQRRQQQQQQHGACMVPESARSIDSTASFASDISGMSTRSSGKWARFRSAVFRK